MASLDTNGLYSLWNDDVGNKFNFAVKDAVKSYTEKKRYFEEKITAAKSVSENIKTYSSFVSKIDLLRVD